MDFLYLQEHLGELVGYMRGHKYAETYVNRYKTTVSQITTNASDHSWNSYGDVFLWYRSRPYKNSYLREIKAILGKLERFHLHGAYPDAKASKSSFWKKRASYYQLTLEYQGLVDYYCQAERQRGLAATTIYSGAHKSASFLLSLQNQGEDALKKVTEAGVLSCFYSKGKTVRGASCSRVITAFFQVCASINPVECQRIGVYIPTLRAARKNIRYLSDEEFTELRAALDDHTNGLSLKDRAIGFLLMYTGMRGGDIASLLVTSIDWNNDKIHLLQQKTRVRLELPLSAIVGNAIYDYCVCDRPKVDNPHLFLSCFAPHGSLTTDGIGIAVSRIMEKANVRQHAGARKGTHIFRHRVAMALLKNGVPQPVINSTLGHTAPCSLASYLYADITHLKECALDVERFAVAEGVFAHV